MNTVNAPVIIGGCHRSGTSLLRRIINAHSRIYCGPEVKFFRDFYSDYFHDPLNHLRFSTSARSMLPEAQLLDILGDCFVRIHEAAARNFNKPRWADKCPENVLFLDKWDEILGEHWYFVHVLRNPVDVIASMEEAGFDLAVPTGLEARIAFYIRYTEAGLDFSERHPDRSYRVWYEDVVADPRREISQLMNWLGEEFELNQLDYNQAARHQPGLEDPNVRGENSVHARSVGRGSQAFSTEQLHEIQSGMAGLWKRLGANPDLLFPERAV